MDIPFEKMKRAEIKSMLATLGLLDKRNEVLGFPSLLSTTLNSIFKNVKHFINLPTNPFKELPECLVHELLHFCQTHKEKEKPAIYVVPAKGEKKQKKKKVVETLTVEQVNKFAKMLLENSNIRRLNVFSLSGLGEKNCVDLTEHVLENCPNLVYISAPSPVDPKYDFYTKDLADKLILNWSKLRKLDLMGFYPTDDVMELIQQNLPKLEHFNLCIAKDKFSFRGAARLTALKCLTDLEIFINNYYFHGQYLLNMLVGIAGQSKNLQRLYLNTHNFQQLGIHFARFYGVRFPRKKLTCPEEFYIIKPVNFMWPQCLHLDKIVTCEAAFTEDTLHSLGQIPSAVSQIRVVRMTDSQFLYRLMQIFGHSLKSLFLHENCKLEYKSKLNLYKVMSACPKLETFFSGSCMPLEHGPKFDLAPENFVNMKSFLIGESKKHPGLEPFVDIFKMVLIGSKNYKILEVQNEEVLEATAAVLAKHPDCMKEIELFNVVLDCFNDEDVLLACKLLMLRSPHLKTLDIHGDAKPPKWFYTIAKSLKIDVHIRNNVTCEGHDIHSLLHIFDNKRVEMVLQGLEKAWQKRYFEIIRSNDEIRYFFALGQIRTMIRRVVGGDIFSKACPDANADHLAQHEGVEDEEGALDEDEEEVLDEDEEGVLKEVVDPEDGFDSDEDKAEPPGEEEEEDEEVEEVDETDSSEEEDTEEV